MTEVKKYDDIPELTDDCALFHPKRDYTYIINAEKYQETGEIEVKRVLKKDLLPEASASYAFFMREGCQGYPLKEQDLYLKSAGYVGPFQMDASACNIFLEHIDKEHPELSQYIEHDKKGNVIKSGKKGYLDFVKKCPDKDALLKVVEEYALSDYFNNRVGKPETLASNLAAQLDKTDSQGNPDATRLPLHVIASMPTGVIARGNGKDFNKKITTFKDIDDPNLDRYCKTWISDKNRGVPAYETLKEVDYLTPEIISQYQTMNLAGAEELQAQYLALVEQKENEKEELGRKQHDELLARELQSAFPTKLPSLSEFPDLYGRQVKMDSAVEKSKQNKKDEKKNEAPQQSASPQHTEKQECAPQFIPPQGQER